MEYSAELTQKIKQAFDIYAKEECDRLEQSAQASQITFSPDFEKRMDKLFTAQSKPGYYMFNTVGKRVAAIAIAIVLALTTTAFSVKAIRDPLVRFITETFEKFTNIIFDNSEEEIEFTKCELGYVPEGFELVEKTETKFMYREKYKSIDGTSIVYTQQMNASLIKTIDTEMILYRDICVNGLKGIIYENRKEMLVMISSEQYSFTICGNIAEEEIIKIAESIKIN